MHGITWYHVVAKYEYRCCVFDGERAKRCDLRHGQYNRNQGNEGPSQGIYINYSVFDWYSFLRSTVEL
jgi:hypothetical protein